MKAERIRRAAGAVDRATYLARGQDRAQIAIAAAVAGRTIAAIAADLGVAVRTVQRYLATSVSDLTPDAATSPCPPSGRVDPSGASERARELEGPEHFRVLAVDEVRRLLEYARVRLGDYEPPPSEPSSIVVAPIYFGARSERRPRWVRRRFHARL